MGSSVPNGRAIPGVVPGAGIGAFDALRQLQQVLTVHLRAYK